METASIDQIKHIFKIKNIVIHLSLIYVAVSFPVDANSINLKIISNQFYAKNS